MTNDKRPSLLERWRCTRLGVKLIGAVLLVVAVATLVSGVNTIVSERRILMGQVDAQGASLARATAIFAIEPLLVQDYPVLETYAENMVQGKYGVSVVRIARADGRVVAEASADGGTIAGSVRVYTADIKVSQDAARAIGKISVGISMRRSRELVASRLWALGVQSVTTFFVLALLLSLLLKKTVADPLRRLTGDVNEIRRTGLNRELRVNSRDEIGQLGSSFNAMLSELRSASQSKERYLKELQTLNHELEDRVLERTQELEASQSAAIRSMEQAEEAKRNAEQVNDNLEREIAERKQAEESLAKRTRRLEGLIRTSAKVIGTIEVNDTLRTIAKEAANLLGVAGAGFRLLEEDRLVVGANYGLAHKVMVRPAITVGDSLSGRVAQGGRAIAVSDLREESHHDPEHQQAAVAHGVVAYLGVPLRYRERIIGVLNVYAEEPRTFPVNETELLQAFADQAAIAIEKARLYAQARRHAEELQKEVSERKRVEEERLKLSSAIEQAADAVVITDKDGVVEYVNPAFEQMTGFSREEVLGGNPNIIKSGRHDRRFYKRLWQKILNGRVVREVFVNRRKDGELYYEEKTITPLRDSQGHITHFVSTGEDITERMQVQERLHFLAHHDVLTQLPNRALFMDRLNQVLARAQWHDRIVSVLFLDLDRFKNINDTLGHDVGDCLLQRIAERLRSGVRDGDTVARFGGDEFAILLQDIADVRDVAPITQKLLDLLSAPFKIGEHELFVTASVGVSTYPNDGSDPPTLLKHADTAMYRAKEQGGNTHQFYSPEMSTLARERLRVETSLRRALERQEFRLHYQPLVDSRTGQVTGVEALIRWDHPDSGLVPPMQFVPVLEETGLMVAVGEWVVRQACLQCRRLREAVRRPLILAVNVSSRQFRQKGLVEVVEKALQDAHMEPQHLQLEITESVLMDDPASAAASLRALRNLGVRIALDDFGTAYSSLSYLREFPIDTVKVDRSFVRDIAYDAEDAALVRAIIQMCHTLNLQVIAEGVETPAQLALLQEQSCHVVQGYLFSKPLPIEEMIQYLENHEPPQRKRRLQCGR